MPIIPFGEWLPDAAALGNPGAIVANNVYPGPTSYKPAASLLTTSNALDARARGAVAMKDNSNNVHQFAGDAAKLYRIVGTTWTDSSIMGGYSTGAGERWEFTKFNNKVLATNFSNNPQQLTLGGTAFSDLTTALKARRIATVRDFVVMGNTFDGVDGNQPQRVRWSSINNETDWTVSPTTLADFRDLKTGGAVQAICGGQFGVIVSESSVFRMTWVGSPTVFQIDEVLPGIGALAPGGTVCLGDVAYIMSDKGFVALENGANAAFIGAGKVDRWFLKDLDFAQLHRVYSAVGRQGSIVAWLYPGAGNTGGLPNRIIAYNRTLDRWSTLEVEAQVIWSGLTFGLTLEDLDAVSSSIDALGSSLDSPEWQGGVRTLAGFDSANKSGFFQGATLKATLETKEVELNPGFRTTLNEFYPVVDGANTMVAQLGTRNRQTDGVSYAPPLLQSPTGIFAPRSNARYHRFRISILGEDWSDAIGVQVERENARRGEGRG